MNELELIPGRWETERFFVRMIEKSDGEAAQRIYEAAMPSTGWGEGTFNPVYIRDVLAGKPELPPGGEASRALVQLVYDRNAVKAGEPVAIMELYHGYPGAGDLYIGLFGVSPGSRGLGYGKEITAGITEAAFAQGYESVRAAVDLKNWPGLRFWLGCGFTDAVKIKGEKEHSEKGIAVIELANRRNGR
ncbi:GNAT family N-acetyltransferase [Paenibacillus pasadenensis]|uniref:GNAT family N-acetyltransferase n=1 Tax=Paenibacillus pasadenensis TaxID=217090 RepID=UPI00203E4123|nr:GNAT family N-acetyltransferase [Paenibacillus pasadenensis]MCM3749947.1 GNAT family N-acetyltransferase [Paenibacillus pasadenensis]